MHEFVDKLPDSELAAAKAALTLIAECRHDPMLLALLTAPSDDEPTTREEDAGAAEAREQYRRGDYLSAGDAKRLLLQ